VENGHKFSCKVLENSRKKVLKNYGKPLLVHCVKLAFLRATAATAVAHLSHRNVVCSSVCVFVTWVDQWKTVQARITKSSPPAAWKTLVSVKLFHKFERGHPGRGR